MIAAWLTQEKRCNDYNDDTVHVVKFYLMHSFRGLEACP